VNSPVVSSAEMRVAEKAAFARGVSAETLMNEAGAGIARVIRQFFPTPARCLVFAGKGNNGGDALVAATHLKHAGWLVDIHLAYRESECGDLLRKKIAEFRDAAARDESSSVPFVVLDGLLGLGSKPPLCDPILNSVREINRLRREQKAYVFAVDLPSGLDGDTGAVDADYVVADFTVTIGAAKRGLVADDATNFVGRLEVIPLAELRIETRDETVSCVDSLIGLPRRPFDSHKNQFGRIGILAGSRGFVGAASMCAWGALRGGAGLVEVFVPPNIYEVVATAAPFEAMIKPIKSYDSLLEEKIDVWAIGPGTGRTHSKQILRLITAARQPVVIDADALNILSADVGLLKKCRGPRLLTPHPGEMRRLAGEQKILRAEIARKFTREFPVTLLLKGSRTIVAEAGKQIAYNTTGNPGMATGGMGDVLTGVCAALIAQKLSLFDAARLSAWACGRAAEVARFNYGASEQSLLPRDVLNNLGAALSEV
jgi:hydroxyethylthiazole kinase-like uncharacterized protein yjeF